MTTPRNQPPNWPPYAGFLLAVGSAPAWAANDDLQHVIPDAAAHQLGDTPFSVQGLSILLGIVGILFTLWVGFRRVRRENEADARASEERIKEAHRADAERIERAQRERSDEIKSELSEIKIQLGERVSKLETASADFMPRKEIEAKIEHEKANRITSDQALERRQEATASDVRDLLVKVGQLTQRQDGFGNEMAEIKTLIKDGFREQNAKIDRMAESSEQGRRR